MGGSIDGDLWMGELDILIVYLWRVEGGSLDGG